MNNIFMSIVGIIILYGLYRFYKSEWMTKLFLSHQLRRVNAVIDEIAARITNCKSPEDCLQVTKFIRIDFDLEFRGKIPNKFFNTVIKQMWDALEAKYQVLKPVKFPGNNI